MRRAIRKRARGADAAPSACGAFAAPAPCGVVAALAARGALAKLSARGALAPVFALVRAAVHALSFAAVISAFALAALLAALSPAFVEKALADDNLVNPQQLPDSSFIYDTLIADLATADSYLDGQTVQVTGEAVGDSIREGLDGENRWITLQAVDGSYAQVTAYMTAEAAERVDTFGAYGKTGTTLQVRGTFNLACAEHEGLTDLHANHVSVVEKGSVSEEPFEASAFAPGAVLVLLGGVLLLVFYRMRERLR